MLTQITSGDPSLPPLVLAHGLYGQARNWTWHAKSLADIRHIIAVDMRNHGDSPWSDDHSYGAMGDDLAHVVKGPTDLLGHSMGGKAAMVAALTHPNKIRRLIIADIAPVTYDHNQMEIVDAMRGLDLTTITRRSQAAQALVEKGLPRDVAGFLSQSLEPHEQRWKFNLDVLAHAMPDILNFPHFDRPFDGPTLFLAGADSPYIKREHRDEIKRLFPKARVAKIPKAGHWLHADQPEHVAAAIRAFLTA